MESPDNAIPEELSATQPQPPEGEAQPVEPIKEQVAQQQIDPTGPQGQASAVHS